MNKPRLSALFHYNTVCALFLTLSLAGLLAACQNTSREQRASVNSLTAPLPTATPPKVDPRRTEPERFGAGSTPPDFTLEDKGGRAYTLSDFRGKKNVVLVFYRGYF